MIKKIAAVILLLATVISLTACKHIVGIIIKGEDYLNEHEDEIIDDLNKANDRLNDVNEKVEERGQEILDSIENGTFDESDLEDILGEYDWDIGSEVYVDEYNVATLYNFPNSYCDAELSEYPIGSDYSNSQTVIIDGESVYLGASQCLGFARYVQYKLYGTCDFKDEKNMPGSSNFVNVLGGSVSGDSITEENLKEYINMGGIGAHIRTGGSQHSMIIVDITEDGFTVIDANGGNSPNKVEMRTYTWKSYIDGKNGNRSGYGARGFSYINVYQP